MSDLVELRRLEADLEKDEELRKRLDETVRRIVEEDKAGSDGEAIVAAAAELGYSITVADLERASAEAEDVDDTELASVAGGNYFTDDNNFFEDEYDHNSWCATIWHCFTVSMHTETKKKVACWSNYKCLFVNN